MIGRTHIGVMTAIAVAALGVNTSAHAQAPFTIQLTVNGTATGSRGYSSVDDAINTLSSTPALTSLVPTYTDTALAVTNINLRGLTGTTTYPAGSPVLTVSIPGAGINQTFAGATRAGSAELFRRFLEGRGASSSVFQAFARDTAQDPVAGNPNSLMNRMVAGDFDHAVADATGASQQGASLDARYGSFSGSGLNSHGVSLPLGYSWRLSERDSLDVDVPVALTDTGGATSYSANIGLLWHHRVFTNWALQPSIRFGGVGSTDLGSAAGAWSVGLTSTLKFDLPASWQLTVANGLTYISTIPISIGNYTLNYDLSNVVFRNGLIATHDLGFQVMHLPMRGSVFIIDTRYTGDAVYTDNYQEFGFFASAGSLMPVRIGASYLLGAHGTHGFAINSGVTF